MSSLLEYLNTNCTTWKNTEAFVIRRRVKREVITYSDLSVLVSKFETWLNAEDISVDSKVLFWGLNCPEYAVALLSTLALGRTAVPIDWRNSPETITSVINKTKPTFAFVSRYFKHEFISASGIKVYYIEDLFDLLNSVNHFKTLDDLILNPNYVDPEHISEIVFTSGTTGVPKGVVMKQHNLLTNLEAITPRLPDLRGSRTISVLPLSHMLEQVAGLLLPLGQGTTIYYLPRINSFRLIQAFAEYKPTHLLFVPQLLKIFWGKIEEQALQNMAYSKFTSILSISGSLPIFLRRIIFKKIHLLFGGSLNFIACGGAPLDKQVGLAFQRVGINIIEGYGATEVTAVAAINNLNSPKFGTVGKPLPGVEIKLNSEGEILISGSSLTSGYFEDPERTSQVYLKDGYKTGDIGEFDISGNLIIKGRDVFKIVLPSGEKVFVEDLESKILSNENVKDACITAIKMPDGDKIHAYFILKPNCSVDIKTIVTDINSKLESKQQIISFELWPAEDFSRTPTMKVDRKLMNDVANQKANITDIKGKNSGAVFVYQDILDIVAKVSGIVRERIVPTDTLAGDLAIDSLSRVELVALAEEHLGLMLDEAKISSQTTVSDLETLAQNAEKIEDVVIPMWQFSKLGEILHVLMSKLVLFPLHTAIIKINYPQKTLPAIQPGSIIIFNHPGIMDGVCVARALFKLNRPKLITNSASNFWTNKTMFAKPLELFVGGIPLYETGHRLLKVLQTDSDLMDRGYSLLFAPQGGLQTSEEEDPFKPGIGYIIQQINRPVHFIKIEGYFKIWPVPAKGFENCTITDFLPRKTGTVNVKVSEGLIKDWETMTPIQIANLLEEKFRAL